MRDLPEDLILPYLYYMHQAVSYTHLDVYKRQVQDLGHFLLLYEIHLPDRTCQIFWILHHPLFPVSYTHLDVYKRQAYTRWCDDNAQKPMSANRVSSELAQNERLYNCLLYTSRCV